MLSRVVPTSYHERILVAAHHVGSNLDAHRELITAALPAEPNRLQAVLSRIYPARVVVTGALDRRLLLLQHCGGNRWVAADLSGQPLQTRIWPGTSGDRSGYSRKLVEHRTLSAQALERLTRPTVLLTALYHPETFRSHVSRWVSVILPARARSTLIGRPLRAR